MNYTTSAFQYHKYFSPVESTQQQEKNVFIFIQKTSFKYWIMPNKQNAKSAVHFIYVFNPHKEIFIWRIIR